MKKYRIVLFLTLLGTLAVLLVGGRIIGAKTAIYVTAEPKAQVYVNGKLTGETPLLLERQPGAIDLQLVPVNTEESNLLPFQTTLSLTPQVKTIVRHTFANELPYAQSEIISFEKQAHKKALVTVVTKPASAEVFIDTVAVGKAPFQRQVEPREQTLTVSSPGFVSDSVEIAPISGYNLTLYIELPKEKTLSQIRAEDTTPLAEALGEYKILATAGRAAQMYVEPSYGSYTIGEVVAGKTVSVISQDETYLWLKILVDSVSGWIPSKYAAPVNPTP